MTVRLTRRQILKYSAAAGAGLMFAGRWALIPSPAYAAFINSPGLKKFANSLRKPGPGGIPVAAPDSSPAPITNVEHYTIEISQFTDQLCPTDVDGAQLGSTRLWGYHPTKQFGDGEDNQRHLGGIIVAKRGKPIQITFRNKLSGSHPIPVDRTVMGNTPEANNDLRTAIHLHGGFVPWISDGGPFDWWDPTGKTGASFLNNQVLNPTAAGNEAEYYYPNDQSARMMWYHDHAWGITRINAYAGLATAYILRDTFEEGLVGASGLPEFVEKGGKFELPLVIQDKVFVDAATISADKTWTGPKDSGSLWYAHTYDPKVYKLTGNRVSTSTTNLTPPDPSVVPEFFGDTMLANGTVYPQTEVEPRRYRIRLLNACNARFLNLQLYVDDGTIDGITLNAALAPKNAKGPDFVVVGTEGGFLPAPALVPSNVPFNPVTLTGSLIAAPAERFDLLVDFKGFEGKSIILYNDAPAPFPGGVPNFDYFPGNPLNPVQPAPGFGPNTRQIMRFKVHEAASDPVDQPLVLPDLKPGNEPLPAPLGTAALPVLPKKTMIRRLTLNEGFDAYGRLMQLLGTDVTLVGSQLGRAYLDPATEVVQLNGANEVLEVWQIANLTADTHPVHFHLVDVQIVSRQAFKSSGFPTASQLVGVPIPPAPEEAGWKETVRANPGEVTTVIMKFKIPRLLDSKGVEITVPPSPRLGKGGLGTNPKLTTGYEYVWHCHILEHEEHDMMRPLVVMP